MGKDRGKNIRPETNAQKANSCAAEIHQDDGRVTYQPPQEHKGDWGRHINDKSEEEKESVIQHP